MRDQNQPWGSRVLAIIAIAAAFIFLGQLISFWWIALTAAVSSAVWMMIWLWPERVPERIEGDRMNSSRRLVNK